MADTQRTLAALLTLLADNVTGDISPQDLRDLVVSLAPGHAELYVSSALATTLADTTTWVELNGTYTITPSANGWTQSGKRLVFAGTGDRDVALHASVSMTAASNNQTIELGIAKNGTVITSSIMQIRLLTGTDVRSVALACHSDASVPGDYFSIVVRNTTSASNVTTTKANLSINDSADEV